MKTKELIDKLKNDNIKAKRKFHTSSKNKELFGTNNDTHPGKQPGDFKDKTFIYISATSIDNGTRPLPAGTVFWDSPDIELYNSTGVIIPTNQLTQNRSHIITVKVHNEGDMACNSCIVELFICDPSIGFDRTHATQIGIQTHFIPGHNSITARFDFVPTTANIGHQCLFARAYSYVNVDMPDSAVLFSTFTDRHIGQQNLSIVSSGTTFEFMVFGGQHKEIQTFTLKIRQNKASFSQFKIKELANLKPTNKTITAKQFTCLKNIGPDASKPIIYKPASPISSSFIVKLIRFIISLFFKKRIDKTRFEAMTPASDNGWTQGFLNGQNKVTLDIPVLFLGKNEAALFELEMKNEKTGMVMGGLTIVVR